MAEGREKMGSTQCKGCLKAFPFVPETLEEVPKTRDAVNGEADQITKAIDPSLEGGSESSRYECQSCHHHYCVDCDVFCHQTLFNCPGCQSGPPAQPLVTNGISALADEMDTAEG